MRVGGTIMGLLVGWAMVGAGCTACPTVAISPEALIARHNANAARVRRLWASARVRLSFTDSAGRTFAWGSTSPLSVSNATLLLAKPERPTGRAGETDFVLIGRDLGTELFRVGVDATGGVYYLWYSLGSRRGGWFGRCRYAGAPRVTELPIDPLQLVELLGVTRLPVSRNGSMPAALVTLQTDPCAYVVRYVNPQPVSGNLRLWRETYYRWSDREPPRPFRVRLFDAQGRCRVTAELRAYRRIASDEPPERAPVMPTDIRVTWPAIRGVQSASSMHMRLSEMSVTHPFSRKAFDFRAHLPAGLDEPVQVDAAYGAVKGRRRRS